MHNHLKSLLSISIVVLIFFPGLLPADDRGIQRQTVGPLINERRVALVIGNGSYRSAPLRNPVHDARLMAETLAKLGFEVLPREDRTQKQIKQDIKTFGGKLKQGGVGLFYYAGHGMQVGGRNYLIPVKADIESEEDVDIEAVDAGAVLAKMAAAQNLSLIHI